MCSSIPNLDAENCMLGVHVEISLHQNQWLLDESPTLAASAEFDQSVIGKIIFRDI